MPGKILLIEDEPSNSRLIEVTTLRPLGLETVIGADGVSGLQAARDPAIAVIAIPKLDGWQVRRRLRCNDGDAVSISFALPGAQVEFSESQSARRISSGLRCSFEPTFLIRLA